jgi:NTE family protein
VRMSMSIPVFFEPVDVKDPQTGDQHMIVDGGMLSNYPIWLFDTDPGVTPAFPTFGMLLVAPDQTAPLLPTPPEGEQLPPIHNDIDFVRAIAETMMEAHDRFYVDQANYARTIAIPTLGVGTTEFDITPERASALFESGRAAAKKFLDSWDFTAYIQQFRTGTPPTRRASLLART